MFRIRAIDTSTTPAGVVVLGNDANREVVSNFAPGISDEIDAQTLIESAWKRITSAGNSSVELGWRTDRSHATREAAARFALEHLEAVPKTCDLEIEVGDIRRVYRNAVRQSVRCAEWGGVGTVFDYRFAATIAEAPTAQTSQV